MLFFLGPSSPVPLYSQLSEQICLAIASGRIAPDERLPGIHLLAQDFRINVRTDAKSYNELIQRGVLEKRVGIGTYPSKLYGERVELRTVILEKRIRALRDDSKQLKMSLKEVVAMSRNAWDERSEDLSPDSS